MDPTSPQSSDEIYHDLLPTLPKDGTESILDDLGSARGSLLGFWRWAYSQTLDNTLRGVLAEYIVGLALGVVDGRPRVEWDAFDLTSSEGVTVEVKSAAHLQPWRQQTPSPLKFGIRETTAWQDATGSFATGRSRQAQVYVFCAFTTVDPALADPLDTGQWDFYVASTARMNDVLQGQKSIVHCELGC